MNASPDRTHRFATDWTPETADSSPNFYASLPWLRSVETAAGPYSALAVDDTGRTVPLMNSESESNDLYRADVLFAPFIRPATQLVHLGLRRGYVNTLLADVRPDGHQPQPVRSLLRESGRLPVALYVPETHVPHAINAVGGDATVVAFSHFAKMDGRAESLENQLSTLSAKRRRRVLAEARKIRESELTVQASTLLSSHSADLAQLMHEVQARHGHGGSVSQFQSMFDAQAEHLDAQSIVCTAHDTGELVAFSLCFLHNHTLVVRLHGRAYENPLSSLGFFTVVFHEPMRLARERTAARIEWGITSLRTKTSRGATLEPRYAVLDPRCINDVEGLHHRAAELLHQDLEGVRDGDRLAEVATRFARGATAWS